MSRQPWYQTSCCPTNIVRLLPCLSGYVYARRNRDIFVNLYVAGTTEVTLAGAKLRLEQRTDYPWSGDIKFDVTVSEAATFDLKLRIPAFAQGQPLPGDLYRYLDVADDSPSLRVDGKASPLELDSGYATVSRRWTGTTRIELRLPLTIQRVIANDAVGDLQGKVALDRGPLVYALESADNDASPLELALPDSSQLKAEHQPKLLGGITTIRGHALEKDGGAVEFSAIPYYAWVTAAMVR